MTETPAPTLDRRTLLTGLGLAALPAGAWAKGPPDYSALQTFLDGCVARKTIPGACIAVKRGADPVRFMSAGTLAIDSDAKVTPQTLFRIYSMTKPVTGMAVMKLIEENRLGLDQPVADILPELKDLRVFKTPGSADGETEPLARPILIRHLLTHTAGLGYSIIPSPVSKLYVKNGIVPGGRGREKEPGADLAPARTLEEMVQRLGALPLGQQPGTRWGYSIAFDVLGLVVQRASKMPFYDYLRTRFFEPLQMRDTDFVVPASKLARLTSVNALKDGALVTVEDRKASPFARDRDLPSGGGGLVSTAADYIRFTSMLLNDGALDGRRVLKPETVKLATSNLLPEGVKFGGRNGYGAGGTVILSGGEKPGGEPPGSYSWFGIAGTQMWVDRANQFSVVMMLQQFPTTSPFAPELRAAAYRDLAAIKA